MPTHEPDTRELVRRAAGGDAGAVERLLQRYRARLKKMVLARMDPSVRARIDPSDVIQETLACASRDLPKYLVSQPLPFYPWLRRIAWERLVDHHRQHLDAQIRSVRREEQYDWGISDDSSMQIAGLFVGRGSTPSADASRREICERVRAVLENLSEIDREVLLQRYVEQMTIPEIAAALEKNEAAIYKRHARALQRVRASLEGGSYGPSH